MATYYQLPAANGKGAKLVRYENEIFSVNDVHPEILLPYCANFSHQNGDILLCTFPKCGSHWLGSMVWKLKTLNDDERPNFSVLEMMERECIENQGPPRILQCHLRPSRLPKEHLQEGGKIVLMLRNPKDACTSYYHYMKKSSFSQNGQTFNEYVQSYFGGESMYGSYIDYIKAWEDVLLEKSEGNSSINVELFYYEDFKKNPMKNLMLLNKFLGFGRNTDYLQKVMEQTSFGSMKKAAVANSKIVRGFFIDADGNPIVFRQGEVGDWKKYFTVAQSEKVDELMKQKITNDIIAFQY